MSLQIINLQTELKYLDSFKFYCIFTDLDPLQLWGRGQVVGVSEGVGVAPTCMYTHMHVKQANKHDTHDGSHLEFLYMYILG